MILIENKGHTIFDSIDKINTIVPKSKNNGTQDGKYHIQYEEKPQNN